MSHLVGMPVGAHIVFHIVHLLGMGKMIDTLHIALVHDAFHIVAEVIAAGFGHAEYGMPVAIVILDLAEQIHIALAETFVRRLHATAEIVTAEIDYRDVGLSLDAVGYPKG